MIVFEELPQETKDFLSNYNNIDNQDKLDEYLIIYIKRGLMEKIHIAKRELAYQEAKSETEALDFTNSKKTREEIISSLEK